MYLKEWMYLREYSPKKLAEETGMPIDNITFFTIADEKGDISNAMWDRVCQCLRVTRYQLFCVNPMIDKDLSHYTISTSSFKEMVRLQNYFKTKFAEEDVKLWVFDHGRGEYDYQIHYKRRHPLSIEELHQIIMTDEYKDFREEHQEPSSYFDEAQIEVIHYEGQEAIT